ncbi:MAG: hypothetical protein JWN53_2072 [Gemmatimonadetes bacterium]|jgi:hypothetical protein|nr:hypothetical protein [Gemmatimonadota bacterium]
MRLDSARAAAARAAARERARVAARRPVPPPATPVSDTPTRLPSARGSFVPLPSAVHLTARNDTLAERVLREPLRVCAGGDVTLGTNLSPLWSRTASARMRTELHLSDEPQALLAPLVPLLDGADVVLLNVESAIGEGESPTKCGPRSTHCFAFRSPLAAAGALRTLSSGEVVGNIANNHAHDAGAPGHDSTVAALQRAGVRVTGNDTLATPVPTPAGDTIGVLGFYTSSETPDARDTAAVRRHVARASARYPLVIATMHLGAEGFDAQRTLDFPEQYLGIERGNPVAFADAAVRGGAALVIGHGPHVVRAMEWREHGALIAYSLGNLLTYGPFVLKEPLNRGAILCAVIDATGRVSSATLTSTLQREPGVLGRDARGRAAALVDSLGALDFPTSAVRADTTGTLHPRRWLERR